MEALHPISGQWIEVKGHTVKQITDEMNLPDTSEGHKWYVKIEGEVLSSGSIPSEIDRVEVVEYAEAMQPSPTVSDTSGDSG